MTRRLPAVPRVGALVAISLGLVFALASVPTSAFAAIPTPEITDIESTSIETTADGFTEISFSGTATLVQPGPELSGCWGSYLNVVVDGVELPDEGGAFMGVGYQTVPREGYSQGPLSATTSTPTTWSGHFFLEDAIAAAGTELEGTHSVAVIARYEFDDGSPDCDQVNDYEDASAVSASLAITVAVRAPEPTPTTEPEVVPTEPGDFREEPFGTSVGYGNDVSRIAENPADAAAPSVLSGLPSILIAGYTPDRTVIAALLALAATAIVGLALLGSQGIAAGAQQFTGKFPWIKAVGKRLRRVTNGLDAAARAATSGPPVKVWLVVAATYVVAVLLSALIDPGAGLNAGTVRLLASLLIVFIVQSVLGWLVIRAVLGRGGVPVEFRPTINPGLLLLVVAGALCSRLLGFEPGIIFGALLGLAFGATLQGARQAQVVLVGSGFLVALSFVSWATYSIGVAIGWQTAAPGVFALETLAGLTVAGASGLAIALLPHKAFDGKVIWDWRKLVWAAAYAGGAFYALAVLGAIPVDPSAVSAPLLGWLVLYLVYGIVSLVLWLLARRAARPPVTVDAAAAAASD